MTVRPSSDVLTTGWTSSTGGSVFSTVNESTPNDANYSWAPLDGFSKLVLGLDASVPAGTHRIPLRLSVATGTLDVRVRLLDALDVLQGTSAAQTVTTTPTTFIFTVVSTGTAVRIELGGALPDGYLSLDGGVLSLDGAVIGLT